MKSIPINTITFGDSTFLQLLSLPKYIEDIKLENYNFPNNDSIVTMQELIELKDNSNSDYKEKELDLKINENLELYINNHFIEEKDQDLSSLIFKIKEDIYDTIQYLKVRYNRPRPSQISPYIINGFHPQIISTSSSFPSEKVLSSYLVFYVICYKYPLLGDDCQILFENIINSRIRLGVNYRSDIDTAIEFAQKIIQNEDFSKKYLEKDLDVKK